MGDLSDADLHDVEHALRHEVPPTLEQARLMLNEIRAARAAPPAAKGTPADALREPCAHRKAKGWCACPDAPTCEAAFSVRLPEDPRIAAALALADSWDNRGRPCPDGDQCQNSFHVAARALRRALASSPSPETTPDVLAAAREVVRVFNERPVRLRDRITLGMDLAVGKLDLALLLASPSPLSERTTTAGCACGDSGKPGGHRWDGGGPCVNQILGAPSPSRDEGPAATTKEE